MFLKFDTRVWRWKHNAVLAAFLSVLLLPTFQFAAVPAEIAKPDSFAELNTGHGTGIGTAIETQQRFSLDGALLATFRFINSQPEPVIDLVIWDVQTGEEKFRISEGFSGFEFNSTGTVLAIWTHEKVSILDSQTGADLATLAHGNVSLVKFIPNLHLLVTETRNRSEMQITPSELRFWNTDTWERVETTVDQRMPLTCPVVSTDGKYVAGFEPVARGTNNTKTELKIWELQTGKQLPAPNWPTPGYFEPGLGFTPGGKDLATFGQVWDIEAEAAKPVNKSFDFYKDVEWGRSFDEYARHGLTKNKNKRAKIIDKKIVVWDLHSGEQIAQYDNPEAEPPIDAMSAVYGATIPWVFDEALSFSSKDSRSGSRTIDIFETANWKIIRTILLSGLGPSLDGRQWSCKPDLFCVRVAKDGTTIVVLEVEDNLYDELRRCRVTAYDLETGERKYQLKGHNQFVSMIALSPDSRLIATGSGVGNHSAMRHGEVKLWDMASGELVRTMIGQEWGVHCMAFDNRGDHLAIGRMIGEQIRENEVGVWSTSTGAMLSSLQFPEAERDPNTIGQPPSQAVSPAPEPVLPGGLHTTAAAQAPWLKENPCTSDQPLSLAFSPDDKLLAVGGMTHLTMWEMPNGKFRDIGDIISGPIFGLQFSADGKDLYSRSVSVFKDEVATLGRRRFWDLPRQPFESSELGREKGEIAVNTPDRWIACCPGAWQTNSGEISLWDIESKKLQKVICHYGVQSIDFAPAGQLVTASIRPGSQVTTVLDLETGRELVRLCHFGSAVFSPTGEVFATLKSVARSVDVIKDSTGVVERRRTPRAAGLYGGIDLWETRTGRQLAELPHDTLMHMQFSPDGKIISSVGLESTKLWQIGDLIRDTAK